MRVLCGFVLLAALALPASAQSVTWRPVSAPPSDSIFYDWIVASPAGLFAPSPVEGLQRSVDGGETWAPEPAQGGPEYFYDVQLVGADDLVAGGSGRFRLGAVLYRRIASGEWAAFSALPSECGPSAFQYAGAVARTASGALLAGPHCDFSMGSAGEIFRSTNDGSTWTTASALFATPFGGVRRFREGGGRLYAVRRGGGKGGDGAVQVSADDGATWTLLPPPVDGFPSDIAVVGESLLLAWYVAPEMTGRIFRSTDGGTTWTATALRYSGPRASFTPAPDGAVYVAPQTDIDIGGVGHAGGVPVTRDGGLSWTVLDEGLPPHPVTALALAADGRLVATTYDAVGRRANVYRTEETVVGAEPAPTSAIALAATPNPSSGPVTITFALGATTDATLTIYDALGRRVAQLADGPVAAGSHERTWQPTTHAPGAYIVVLQTAGQTVSRRIAVVR